MLPPLLIMVREGFEAALIVAIVFAYLRRSGRLDLAGPVWGGVVAAMALATAIGVVVHLTAGSLTGVSRLRTFALISFAAAAVLTWMVFWMRRQSRAIKGDLERKVDSALHGRRVGLAVASVAFLAVLREGIEAALFLVAGATTAGGWQVLLGAVIGIAIAAVLGGLVYAGGRRMPMAGFFKVTGMVVVIFAAGLLARGVLFLQSAGDLGTLHDNVYDVTRYAFLTQRTEVGRFLAAMTGWDPRPSLEQVVVWAAYLGVVTMLFLRPSRPRRAVEPASASASAPAPTAR
jgi:high-affinity iron transporter